MKYLRLFENLKDKLPKLDKYLVWQSSDNDIFTILENTNKVKMSGNGDYNRYKIIPVKHLYDYNLKTDILKVRENLMGGGRTSGLIYGDIENSIKTFLIYQSNDLQDCIDTLKIMSDVNKYNL